MMSAEFTFNWYTSISDIPKQDWNSVFSKSSEIKKYDFAKVIEESKLENVALHYLVVSKGQQFHAIFPCFYYFVKLDILSGEGFKKFCSQVRKFHKTFLTVNLFGIGSPIATCENHIGLNPDFYASGTLYPEVSSRVFDMIVNKSNELKCAMILAKEIPHFEVNEFNELFDNKFKVFESLPNSFVPVIKSKYPYPSLLRSRYKSRFSQAIKEVDEQGFKWDLLENYSDITKEMFDLYFNVYTKSKVKFEKLTPGFFENVSKLMPGKSYALTCRNKEGKLICMELIVEDEQAFNSLYMGLDYSETQNSKLYYNVVYRTILEAEKKNKKWVVFGQTSYEAKAYAGGLFERLYVGAYSSRPFLKFLIKNLFKFLFPAFVKPEINNIPEKHKKDPAFQKHLSDYSRIFEQ
jgi:hypothetical protein